MTEKGQGEGAQLPMENSGESRVSVGSTSFFFFFTFVKFTVLKVFSPNVITKFETLSIIKVRRGRGALEITIGFRNHAPGAPDVQLPFHEFIFKNYRSILLLPFPRFVSSRILGFFFEASVTSV